MMYFQGDVLKVQFNPSAGHEAALPHPAIVVSTDAFNNLMTNMLLVCPVTSTDNKHPLHVPIGKGNAVSGFIQVEHMRSIDPARRVMGSYEQPLDNDTMARLLEIIGAVLGI